MHIGIEGDGEKCYVVVQFGDGERAVKGPMGEDDAQGLIDGMMAEMHEEGYAPERARGTRVPPAAVWIGTVITVALLIAAVLWGMR